MAKRDGKDLWKMVHKTAGIVIAIGFLALVVHLFSPKLKQHQKYQETAERLDSDVEILESQITEMQKKRRNFLHDKNYARRVAHEHGFAEEGEVLYKFLDEPAP